MKIPEKISYQPLPVRDALTEMKDLSEVMIDLAYSATLFQDRDLAQQVLALERRIDDLTYILNMNLMLAARDAGDAERLVGITAIASATNEISDAAADIATLTLQEISVHPAIRDAFNKIEERLLRVRLSPTSPFIPQQLGDLDLAARLGVDIIAILRGKRWIIDPPSTEFLHPQDVLLVRGAPSGLLMFRDYATGTLTSWV